MAQFTCEQYLESRIPDIATLLPGYNTAVPINGAMALYWDYFFLENPPSGLDETLLSERQKALVGLRTAIGVVMVAAKVFTRPQVTEAAAEPAITKFEERNKIYRAIMPNWQDEIHRIEAAEGIFFDQTPHVPAFLSKIESSLSAFSSSGYIVTRGVTFVREES